MLRDRRKHKNTARTKQGNTRTKENTRVILKYEERDEEHEEHEERNEEHEEHKQIQ